MALKWDKKIKLQFNGKILVADFEDINIRVTEKEEIVMNLQCVNSADLYTFLFMRNINSEWISFETSVHGNGNFKIEEMKRSPNRDKVYLNAKVEITNEK